MSMKRRMNDSGVSEVVGSILTLAVTVIIFTGIFYGVQNIEPPEQQTYAKFTSTASIADQTAYINITHNGGKVMPDYNTRIYIFVDSADSPHNVQFTDDQGIDLADGRWHMGETMHLEFDDPHEIYDAFQDRDSTIELIILDIDNNQRVHREMIKTKDELAPFIRDVGVIYPLDFGSYAIPGEEVTIWADVVDKDTLDLGELEVWLNLSELGGGLEQMDRRGNRPLEVNRYYYEFEMPEQVNGTYLIPVHSTDGVEVGDITYISLNLGQAPELGIEAELQIPENRIFFLPENPANGDVFEVTAAIYNAGGTATVGDVTFQDFGPGGNELYNETVYDLGFPSGGGRDVSVNWVIERSGLHQIAIEVEYNGETVNASAYVIVRPNILLVDDDQVGDGQPGDDASRMANALDSLGFKYDRFVVGTGSGPLYSGGTTPMANYDIVIWMTGRQTTGTLTLQDRQELNKFIDANHRLWMMGEGICNDAENNIWDGWLQDNLRMDISDTSDDAPVNDLNGIADPVANMTFDIRTPDTGKRGDNIAGIDGGYDVLRDDGNTVGIAYNSTEAGGARTFFMSIRLAAIEEQNSASRSTLAYHVILWLGNISDLGGNDLAISDQDFSTRTPDYMDVVTISGVVRNNGIQSLSPEVGLEVNGGIVERKTVTIGGGGQHIEVEFDWVADSVGSHEIRVIVDPYGHIPETNIQNNYPDYLGIDLYVNVRFTTLLVDDTAAGDDTFDNVREFYDTMEYSYENVTVAEGDDGPSNTTMESYNSICWLTGTKTNDTLSENDIRNIVDILFNHTDTKNFILIGDGILEDLTTDAPPNAAYFLQNALKIDNVTSTPVLPRPKKFIGVTDDPVSHGINYFTDNTNVWTPLTYQPTSEAVGILYDEKDNIFAHRYGGDDYRLIFTAFDLDNLQTPIPPGEEEYYDTLSFNTSAQSMRSEFLYLVNHWFGTVDERIELRISDVDITLSDPAPMLGRSYLITVRVQNIGGTGSNVLVRFRDGHSHIGSVSAYVPADGFSDVEVKWNPINAAPTRPLRVILDPIDEVAEIPNWPGENNQTDLMGFNNQAILHNPVYYFYDDMELDSRIADNWQHEAQIARISGETESALDFMGGYGELDTNVADDWDWNMTHEQVQNVSFDAYSDPDSYFMYEPIGKIGRKADVFVALAIDTSGSMANTFTPDGRKWSVAAGDVSRAMVANLSDESIVTICVFNAEEPLVATPPTKLDTEENRTIVNNRLDGDTFVNSGGIHPQGLWGGSTPFWDTVGLAYEQAEAYTGPLQRAVVVLGDGCDADASDQQLMNPTVAERFNNFIEQRSTNWGPWHNMYDIDGNYNVQGYSDLKGKYSVIYDDHPGYWGTVYPTGNRIGLLNADIPFYTIGLGIEHYDLDVWNGTKEVVNPIEDPEWKVMSSWPGGTPIKNYYNVFYDPTGPVAGTVEYNLYQIAETSGGKYFYSPDGAELGDIFDSISQYLSGPQNLTSVPGDSNTIMSTGDDKLTADIPNVDKYAVTPELDLTDTSSAWLTFMHKYRLIQGVNGAYIEVGYHDPGNSTRADGMMWRYIKPTVGPYTGNLLLQVDLPRDSFNNTIKWCWNGKSAAGTMQWEYVRVNLLRDDYNIPEDKLDTVRVRFYYKQYGGGLRPGGWLIDDVSVVVSREGNLPDNIVSEDMHDVWNLQDNVIGRDGEPSRAWWNAYPRTGWFQKGIDNRLVTSSIDLTNARTVNFTADFKFNINSASGSPPDGFRVEVTRDGGRTWEAINVGIRTAKGISTGPHNWTTAGQISTLNVDLSDYSGEIIRMRFRVFTNANDAPYEDDSADHGGLYVDNVIVHGRTN